MWHWYVDFLVDVAFMIDFVLNLRTAYYDKVGPPYRGSSLTRKRTSLGPYRRPMPRALGGS